MRGDMWSMWERRVRVRVGPPHPCGEWVSWISVGDMGGVMGLKSLTAQVKVSRVGAGRCKNNGEC